MDELKNPYRAAAGARPPFLVGREVRIVSFRTTLGRARLGRPGKSTILIGLRGVGKTVLLGVFREMAKEESFGVAFLEAERGTLRRAVATQLRPILLELDRRGKVSRAVRQALAALESFVWTLSDGSTLSLNVGRLAGTADSGDLTDDLTDLLLKVGEAARDRGTGVALIVDEIQNLEQEELGALISAVHRTVQEDLPIVLSGAGLAQIAGLAGTAKAYAERSFEFPAIGNLSDDEARKALTVPAAALGVRFTDDALDLICAHTCGYPYFQQEWGFEVWNVAEGKLITRADVERAAPSVRRRLDENFFRIRMDRLSPLERRYLRAMAELGPGPHRSGAIAAEMGVPVERVAPRRARLIQKGMLYSPAHGLTAFTVPMFDEFLRRELPSDAPEQAA